MCTDLLRLDSTSDDAPEAHPDVTAPKPAPGGFAFDWLLAEATATGWSCPDDHWLE